MTKMAFAFTAWLVFLPSSFAWIGAGEQTFLGLIHRKTTQGQVYRIVECRQGLEAAQALGQAYQSGQEPNSQEFGCHELSGELTHQRIQRIARALAGPNEYVKGACASASLVLGFVVAAALGEHGTLVNDIPSFLGVLTPTALSLFPALQQTWLHVRQPELGHQVELANEWKHGGDEGCNLHLEFPEYQQLKQTVIEMLEHL